MASKLRITHVMPQIGVGGAERQLFHLITRSDPGDVRHRVLYYADSLDTEQLRLYEQAGVSVVRVVRSRRRPLRFVADLAGAIRAEPADIVQCWLYSGMIWGRLAALRAGVRHIVVTHRGIEVPHAWAVRLLEVCTRRRVRYVANSRACARTIGAQIGIDADRFTVLYNGIDADSYYVPGARDEVRRELGVSDGEKLVVMVGRLTPLKNYPMLFRVARRCRKRLPIRFVIVGHGELEADLRALVIQEGIDDIVQFLGLRLDVPRLLASADVFCYTSDSEGFPNALLEAMAAGCAIVTTDFPGADELIAHERNGLIVPRDDDAAAAAAVLDLCSDRDRAAALGRCARMQAVAEFSMERMVRQTIGLYHTIIEGDT